MTIDELIRVFEVSFGPVSGEHALRVHAPGRSEISGNHTDHEGGHVIAASLDVAVDGIACTNGNETVRVASKGYPLFEVGLGTLDVHDDELGTTTALVRGMAHEVAGNGGVPTGFDLTMTSTIPRAAGSRALQRSRRRSGVPWRRYGEPSPLALWRSPR